MAIKIIEIKKTDKNKQTKNNNKEVLKTIVYK